MGDGRGSDCRPNCSVYQAVSASTHTGRDISSEDEVSRSGSSYLGPARGGARYVAYGRDNSAAGYLGGGRHVLDLARELEVERVISPQAAPLRIFVSTCATTLVRRAQLRFTSRASSGARRSTHEALTSHFPGHQPGIFAVCLGRAPWVGCPPSQALRSEDAME